MILRIFYLLILAALGLLQNTSLAEQPKRPNVVLIMADDLGFECIGANGGTSYKTPTLDQLARTGTRFNHCYSQPLCTPSRVQIMTGIYNVRNYEKFGVLPVGQTTFANLFRDAGYKTCVVGKWQLGAAKGIPDQFGFDNHCLWYFQRRAERYPNPGVEMDGVSVDFSDGEYGPDVVSDYACQFMEKNRDQPFLLYYPMILTHCPFCPTPDSSDWDPADKGSKTYKGDAKYFGDMVTYMDKIVGKLVAKLEELELRDNTLILFTGDNGTDVPVVSMLGDREVAGAKNTMTDGGTRVPLIANWPGHVKSGIVLDDLVDFTDFLPTITHVADVEVPGALKLDGQSFWPQLTGQVGKPREWIYVWYSRGGGKFGQQFTRNQRYKLYDNGKFFDIQNDVMEQSPISTDSLDASQRSTREMLQAALDRFQDARPADVAARGKSSNRKQK